MNFRDGITPVLDGMRRALSQRVEAAPCPPPPTPPADPTANFSTFQPFNFSTAPKARPPLHNLLAHRPNARFPMIGKKVSNGWKNSVDFSNDWKNFSPLFQRLEKIFRPPHLRPPSPKSGRARLTIMPQNVRE